MKQDILDFYAGKRVFLTGHTGFKGAWLSRILLQAGAEVTGFSRCSEKAPSLFALAQVSDRMVTEKGEVQDYRRLHAAMEDAQPEIVFHLAAQPIVRESYARPLYTYESNVMGTVNLLESVRSIDSVRSVLNVTTDKVYLNREWSWGYRENEPLDGFDPYSNSKSCSELVTHCYVNSFFSESSVAVSTARAGNVIGGGDFAANRIIPDCVRAIRSGTPLAVRNPHSIRPYQHVLEPLFAYLLIAKKQYEDRTCADWYNVGPDDCDCVTTGRLADLFREKWGAGFSWEDKEECGAVHEAGFLKLDCSKIKARLGWTPTWNIERAVEETVEWTKAWLAGEQIPQLMDKQIQCFVEA